MPDFAVPGTRHTLLVAAVFLGVLAAVLLIASLLGEQRGSRSRAVGQRLRQVSGERRDDVAGQGALLIDRDPDSELPEAIRRVLGETLSQHIIRVLVRSGTRVPPVVLLGGTVLASTVVAAACLAAGLSLLALPLGLLALFAPAVVLSARARERSIRFSAQYAEVLDFMARSMRTGHDLLTSMRIVGEEFPEPIGEEFRRAVEEVSFGVQIDEAIGNMAERVTCYDLGYLIACVSIQRETGGSLSGALSNLAKTIRERTMFEGKVRVLSAQGRLSAMVLCALPLMVLGFMYFTNKDYVAVFWTTRTGEQLLTAAILLLIIGSAWVMKTVRVKV